MNSTRNTLMQLLAELKPASSEEKANVSWYNDEEVGSCSQFSEWKVTHGLQEVEIKQAMPIKRLILKSQTVNRNSERGNKPYSAENGILDVCYTEPVAGLKKMTFYVACANMPKLKDCLQQAGVELRSWGMLSKQTNKKADWSRLVSIYDNTKNANILYSQIHEAFIKQAKEIVEAYRAKHPGALQVHCIEIGPGASVQMLQTICEESAKAMPSGAVVQGFAIEEIGGNVAACQRTMKASRIPLRVVEGDANQLIDILHANKLLESKEDILLLESKKDILRVLYSSGSLARQTLNNAFEPAHIVKSSWRCHIQYIVASSLTDLLLTEGMINHMGYWIKTYKILNFSSIGQASRPLIVLERQPLALLVRNAMDKLSQNPERLSLFLSPSPRLLLSDLEKTAPRLIRKIKTINLSFSHLESAEDLNATLKNFTGMEEIIFTSHRLEEIQWLMFHVNSSFRLQLCWVQQEKALIGSEAFLERMDGVNWRAEKDVLCSPMNVFIEFARDFHSNKIVVPLSAGVIGKDLLLEGMSLLMTLQNNSRPLFSADITLKPLICVLAWIARARENIVLSDFLADTMSSLGALSPAELKSTILALMRANQVEALKELIKNSDISLPELIAEQPALLTLPIDLNSPALLRLFHEEKVDLTVSWDTRSCRLNIMIYAIKTQNTKMIVEIAKISPELVDIPLAESECTPLVYTLYKGMSDLILSTLLDCQPRLDWGSIENLPVLQLAQTRSQVKLLKQAGADFFAGQKDDRGSTAFSNLLIEAGVTWQHYTDWSIMRSYPNVSYWHAVLELLNSEKRLVDNPCYDFQDKIVPLIPCLVSLAVLIHRQASEKEASEERMLTGEDTLGLYVEVAKRFHCEEGIRIVEEARKLLQAPKGKEYKAVM